MLESYFITLDSKYFLEGTPTLAKKIHFTNQIADTMENLLVSLGHFHESSELKVARSRTLANITWDPCLLASTRGYNDHV